MSRLSASVVGYRTRAQLLICGCRGVSGIHVGRNNRVTCFGMEEAPGYSVMQAQAMVSGVFVPGLSCVCFSAEQRAGLHREPTNCGMLAQPPVLIWLDMGKC